MRSEVPAGLGEGGLEVRDLGREPRLFTGKIHQPLVRDQKRRVKGTEESG